MRAEFCNVTCGVPQCSVLGGELFILYDNGLVKTYHKNILTFNIQIHFVMKERIGKWESSEFTTILTGRRFL